MNFYTLFNPVRKKRGRLYKTLLVMKMVTFIIFVACLQVSAKGLAQKITLNVKDVPLGKVFDDIKKQTGYIFFYENNALDGTSKVSINVKEASLQEVLDQCIKNQSLVYTIAGNTIGVKKKEKPQVQEAPAPPIDVTGQLTNKQGEPLGSATILIKRTKTGTLTDLNGNFTLRGIYQTDTLIFSYIGYKTLYIKVGNKTVFDEVMQETTNSLDAVVVQAYGTTTQRLATGNIATVTAKEIETQPVMNPLLALQGKVPGLVVSQTSGYASAPVKVEIRGRSQIDGTLPSEPLFIIDGVPLTILENTDAGGSYSSGSVGFTQGGMVGPANGQSPFFSINPDDIESITVLKDADATAIYGSRGANGVIIINTKKGKAGKTQTEVNAYQGINRVTNHYDMLNTQQYLEVRKEAYKNDGITPNVGNAYDLLTWNTNRYTDWQKYLWGGTGRTTDAQMSLSGGDKQTTFRINGAYHRETDITTVSGASQKSSLQFNLTHKSLDQRLSISLTSTYSYVSVDAISLAGASALPPDAPAVFTNNGALNWAGWSPVGNPFSQLLQPYTSTTGFLNSQLALNYQLFKNLNFQVNLGYSTAHDAQHQIEPISSQNPAYSPTGSAQFGNNANSNLIAEPQITYNTLIGKGKLQGLLGGSTQSASTAGNTISGNGYTDDNLLGSISNAPTVYGSDFTSKYKYAAIFGRLNYNWEDKYILNLSARRDGSSRFGPGKQFGNFGALGAAWIFTGEDWAKKLLSFLSFGKLRGSYGITGSDDLPNYQYLSAWSGSTSVPYIQNVSVYDPARHANPDLQWQVNKKLEAALDLGFLADRINLEIAWYRDRTGNQLVSTPLSIITGFTSVEANFPATVQNSGVESTVNAKLIANKDFQWSVNFNIGINRNKLISFPGLAQSSYASVLIVGQPLNITRLLHYTGIDPQTGQYLVEDKNHDGKIDTDPTDPANDFYIKDLSIKYEGGFGTYLHYKNLELNVFFRFRKQMIPGPFSNIGTPGTIGNYPIDILNRWQKPGDVAQFARYSTQQSTTDFNYSNYSDARYVDGSYIRLQNLALTYNVPEKWLKIAHIDALKFFIYGENLFLITKYKGIDPDVPGFGGLPPAKTFTAGIKFNF